MHSETGLNAACALFLLVAAYFIYSGLAMDTSVPNPDGLGSTVNLQLLHVQAMNLHLGIGAAVMSAIFAGAAAIVGTIRRAN